MKKILLLDDDNRVELYQRWLRRHGNYDVEIEWVDTIDKCIEKLQGDGFKNYDVLSLDHDLADYKDRDGNDMAKWLVDNKTSPNTIFVHSKNIVGAKEIVDTLTYSGLGLTVIRIHL